MLKMFFPTIYKVYELVDLPWKFGVWMGASLNINFATKLHNDGTDFEEGICCIIAFGDFEGGELWCPSECVHIKFGEGDVFLFHSYKFKHVVKNFVGKRYTIALFTTASSGIYDV